MNDNNQARARVAELVERFQACWVSAIIGHLQTEEIRVERPLV